MAIHDFGSKYYLIVIVLLPPIVFLFLDILEMNLASSTINTPTGGFNSASLKMLL